MKTPEKILIILLGTIVVFACVAFGRGVDSPNSVSGIRVTTDDPAVSCYAIKDNDGNVKAGSCWKN